jgi:hypothetical protein
MRFLGWFPYPLIWRFRLFEGSMILVRVGFGSLEVESEPVVAKVDNHPTLVKMDLD